MKTHHEIALQEAEDWLANVDTDEFLDEFLKLQDKSCGPTVDEFIQTFNIPNETNLRNGKNEL
jgi:hypothetical protein